MHNKLQFNDVFDDDLVGMERSRLPASAFTIFPTKMAVGAPAATSVTLRTSLVVWLLEVPKCKRVECHRFYTFRLIFHIMGVQVQRWVIYHSIDSDSKLIVNNRKIKYSIINFTCYIFLMS